MTSAINLQAKPTPVLFQKSGPPLVLAISDLASTPSDASVTNPTLNWNSQGGVVQQKVYLNQTGPGGPWGAAVFTLGGAANTQVLTVTIGVFYWIKVTGAGDGVAFSATEVDSNVAAIAGA